MTIFGDCLDGMRLLGRDSVDAVVTDPPYGLSFMNKKWDYDVPSVDVWREVLRVLKPGGHLLSFGGTRTYHRMVVNVEDAGFEIRDQVQWIYGSGFPKSLNVGLAIDKKAGVIGARPKGFNTAGGKENFEAQDKSFRADYGHITEYKTADALTWQGWGTALKPANEPIVLARKPLEKGLTVAQNVLKYGTGAINVNAGRIGMQPAQTYTAPDITGDAFNSDVSDRERKVISVPAQGRWPANVLLDEVASTNLNAQVGRDVAKYFYCEKASKRERNAGLEGMPDKHKGENLGQLGGLTGSGNPRNYLVKNHHPTVKPIKLMEYLIKLITPPRGVVLDPFMGSGSTGVACKHLGFEFIGIEMNGEYIEIARRRIA